MRRFWILLHLITALGQVPFALGLHHVLARLGVEDAPWIAVAAAALMALLLRGRIRRVRDDRPLGGRGRLLAEELYYVHWCGAIAGALLFAAGLVLLAAVSAARGALAAAAAWVGASEPAGQLTVGAIAAAAYATGLALAIWGVLIRRRWVRVRTIDVPVPGLGAAFEGYRIAQLSDLHVGSLCPPERHDAWVDRANALGADLVALTGDYVTSGVHFHQAIAAALGRLKARDGVAAVMGNHDYFGDGEPLISAMRAAGIRVLRNERAIIVRGGDRLEVAGVDDRWTRRADIEKTLAGRDPTIPLIALAHDPVFFPRLAERGAALVLSGHTHWGQVAAPFLATRHNLAKLAFRFHSGEHRQGSATLVVHPGMGTTGPPVRLGVPPEITVIRLRRAGEGEAARPAAQAA
jgi:predicted MPP superfamily phosphohydrolase